MIKGKLTDEDESHDERNGQRNELDSFHFFFLDFCTNTSFDDRSCGEGLGISGRGRSRKRTLGLEFWVSGGELEVEVTRAGVKEVEDFFRCSLVSDHFLESKLPVMETRSPRPKLSLRRILRPADGVGAEAAGSGSGSASGSATERLFRPLNCCGKTACKNMRGKRGRKKSASKTTLRTPGARPHAISASRDLNFSVDTFIKLQKKLLPLEKL